MTEAKQSAANGGTDPNHALVRCEGEDEEGNREDDSYEKHRVKTRRGDGSGAAVALIQPFLDRHARHGDKHADSDGNEGDTSHASAPTAKFLKGHGERKEEGVEQGVDKRQVKSS